MGSQAKASVSQKARLGWGLKQRPRFLQKQGLAGVSGKGLGLSGSKGWLGSQAKASVSPKARLGWGLKQRPRSLRKQGLAGVSCKGLVSQEARLG